MAEIIDYDLFQKMKALDNRQDLDGNDFGRDTCCDYLDSLVQDGEKFGVVMFVEPCGNITKWGKSWSEVLDWWIEVFKRQPENWQYIESGWYLMSMSEKGFPDDPAKVFPLTVKAKQILETMEKEVDLENRRWKCGCGIWHDGSGNCETCLQGFSFGVPMETKEICQCGHKKDSHSERLQSCCHVDDGNKFCDCQQYTPIPALLPNGNNPSTAPETAQGVA